MKTKEKDISRDTFRKRKVSTEFRAIIALILSIIELHTRGRKWKPKLRQAGTHSNRTTISTYTGVIRGYRFTIRRTAMYSHKRPHLRTCAVEIYKVGENRALLQATVLAGWDRCHWNYVEGKPSGIIEMPPAVLELTRRLARESGLLEQLAHKDSTTSRSDHCRCEPRDPGLMRDALDGKQRQR